MMVSDFKQLAGSSELFVHLFQGVFTDVLIHLCVKKVDMALISQMRRQEPQRMKDLSSKGL